MRSDLTQTLFTIQAATAGESPVQLMEAGMANFTVRVVLHGATALQYSTLHKSMIAAGAFRRIRGSNNIVYDLPDGEYDMPSTLSAFALMQKVVGIAAKVKAAPKPSVLVTQVADRAWQLVPVPGQS